MHDAWLVTLLIFYNIWVNIMHYQKFDPAVMLLKEDAFFVMFT